MRQFDDKGCIRMSLERKIMKRQTFILLLSKKEDASIFSSRSSYLTTNLILNTRLHSRRFDLFLNTKLVVEFSTNASRRLWPTSINAERGCKLIAFLVAASTSVSLAGKILQHLMEFLWLTVYSSRYNVIEDGCS